MTAYWTGRGERTLAGLRAFYEERAPATSNPDEKVLALFREAARDVPAYARFLREHGVDPAEVDGIDAFRRVPATTKDNYYRKSSLPELCRHGRLDGCDMVALSTGSTGEPAVWPRFVSHELESAARFEQILGGAFGAREQRTLGVICFALGNWVGGLYTLGCCRHLAAKGYPLTLAAPGNQPAEILRALRSLSDHCEQRVLFGYPPFLKDVIDFAAGQGFDWRAKPTKLVMAGEVFSEEWRSWVCGRLGVSDPPSATASMYGTADAGVIANETPLSIRIRRALARHPDAARELFGEARLPTLCQYDPRHRYFEVEDGWLLFSGDGGAPLLRYKILDRGGVVDHAAMREFLARRNVELEPGAEGEALPFVYVFGRSHFALSFYGANVYPENVSVGLEQPELAALLTGKFVLEVEHDEEQNARLRLTVELLRGVAAPSGLDAEIAQSVRRELTRLNSEFGAYVPDARRSPQVALRPFGDAEYFPIGVKHRYTRQ
ncbi:MAG TPA: phenylacetate--CoA ligase family protein [Polyangiaceae bacterium]|nr:phenylacetate--CoA ligase family protein [Polyangiaceae bacterium]